MRSIISVIICIVILVHHGIGQLTPLTSEIGINHTYFDVGLNGGGVAFLDYDNDGDEDLYLTKGFGRDKFYENNGDGTFTDMTDMVGLQITDRSYTMGVIAGDVDNDGYRDLFITTWDGTGSRFGVNILFKNNGDKTFTDVWTQENATDGAWSSSATFVDHNNDGLLDLYVLNFIFESGFTVDEQGGFLGYDHDCFENRFYINKGNFEFEEATQAVGLGDVGCGLGVTATDFDGDHDMDIYIANDFGEFVEPNAMYRNDGGTFTKVESNGADVGMYGMGIATGDIDNDLDVDLYVTNIGRNVLLRNTDGNFSDVTTESQCENQWIVQDSLRTTGWGTLFVDVDHDMDLDLVVNNGYQPVEEFILTGPADPNKLYLNDGNGNFEDQSDMWNFADVNVAKGLAYSDYDQDGDIDIFSVVMNDNLSGIPPASTMYRNEYAGENNWFQVKLEGTTVNRDAIGSKVYVYLGEEALYREINGGSSHCSHSSIIAHFGIGSHEEIDSVKIIWAGGEYEQTFGGFGANQQIKLKEGNPTSTNTIDKSSTYSLSPNPTQDYIRLVGQLEVGTELKLVNTEGKIMRQLIVEDESSSIRIDISMLPSGMYFLQGRQENAFIIKSFVVIK